MDLTTHALALAQDMRHPRQNIHQIAACAALDSNGSGQQTRILAVNAIADATESHVELCPESHLLKHLAELLSARPVVLVRDNLEAVNDTVSSAQAGTDQVKCVRQILFELLEPPTALDS